MKFLFAFLSLLSVIACSKSIDTPTESAKDYKLVIKCTSFKRDTLVTQKFTIVRWVCAESKIDTLKN